MTNIQSRTDSPWVPSNNNAWLVQALFRVITRSVRLDRQYQQLIEQYCHQRSELAQVKAQNRSLLLHIEQLKETPPTSVTRDERSRSAVSRSIYNEAIENIPDFAENHDPTPFADSHPPHNGNMPLPRLVTTSGGEGQASPTPSNPPFCGREATSSHTLDSAQEHILRRKDNFEKLARKKEQRDAADANTLTERPRQDKR
ncbi:MAG: hypothetical protein M1825_003205 [Sarcosagium campestre]|nr:MAG: hypothetical protein M1825_003205 [Sarcosagium campestre]